MKFLWNHVNSFQCFIETAAILHPLDVKICNRWIDALAAAFWDRKPVFWNNAEQSMLTAFKNKSKNVLKTRPLTSLFLHRMQKMCKGFAGVLAIYFWAEL